MLLDGVAKFYKTLELTRKGWVLIQDDWLRVQKGWRVNQEGLVMFPGGQAQDGLVIFPRGLVRFPEQLKGPQRGWIGINNNGC